MGSCAVKSKVVDSSSAGGSSAFGNNDPCYPANWTINSGRRDTVVSNIVVSPSAPPAESPSSGGNATWAIAYANESNGVVQQAYGKLRSDFECAFKEIFFGHGNKVIFAT